MEFFIDTETTGLDPKTSKLTEIACMKYDGTSFQQLINPEIPIPEICIQLNGISNEKVLHEPTEDIVLKNLIQWIQQQSEDKPIKLIAHNSTFDESMIRAACQRCQIEWPFNDWFCTLNHSRKCFPEWKQYKLANCVQNLSLPEFNAHRALADVQACQQVYEKIKDLNPIKRKRDDDSIEFIKPKNNGKPWTEELIQELIQYIKEGLVLKEICEKTERSEYSITCMVLKCLLSEKITLQEGRKIMNMTL